MRRVPHDHRREDEGGHDGAGHRDRAGAASADARAGSADRERRQRWSGSPSISRTAPGRRRDRRRATRNRRRIPRRAAACIRQNAAPSSAQSSGPSGSTQLAVVSVKTGERLNRTAAHSPVAVAGQLRAEPVHEPGGQREEQDEGQAHGDRRLGAKQMRRPPGQPPRSRRVIEIAEPQNAPGGDHVALVDAETRSPRPRPRAAPACRGSAAGRAGRVGLPSPASLRLAPFPAVREGQRPSRRRPEAGDQAAATTCCVCSPRPCTPRRMVWPGLRNTGSGFMPRPTPGGVPVLMMSPACSVMKWLT